MSFQIAAEMNEEAPPGDPGGKVGKLDNAISDFASAFVKKELEQLARERDDALARTQVPKLRALLKEVDRERLAFGQEKEKLMQGLRKKLELLDIDPDIIESTLAELNKMSPKYLSIIPSASTLTVRPPTPLMSPARDNYFSTVLGADVLSGAPQSASQALGQGISNSVTDQCSSPTNINVLPSADPNVDHQLQRQIPSESPVVNSMLKRPSADGDGTASPKRRRVGGGKPANQAQSDIFRKIAFPNLVTGERIFRHSERQGLFVIRCNRANCQSGYFTDAPLAYNRALKHFQSHGETGPDGEELSNDYIFENFACQIEGSSLVSKYWIKEHLGRQPHTFVPGKSRSRASQAESVKDRKLQDEDKNYTPSSKPRNPSENIESDEEELESEKPRRTPRSVARPDYAELVANKDPWNLSDGDSEKAIPRSMKEPRAHANGTRKSSKFGHGRSQSPSKESTPAASTSRAKTTESSKPFGYTSEQWPRRFASS